MGCYGKGSNRIVVLGAPLTEPLSLDDHFSREVSPTGTPHCEHEGFQGLGFLTAGIAAGDWVVVVVLFSIHGSPH